MPDDEEAIAMVGANLQGETILPSEKAFAEKLLSLEIIADDAKESKDQVLRYIR